MLRRYPWLGMLIGIAGIPALSGIVNGMLENGGIMVWSLGLLVTSCLGVAGFVLLLVNIRLWARRGTGNVQEFLMRGKLWLFVVVHAVATVVLPMLQLLLALLGVLTAAMNGVAGAAGFLGQAFALLGGMLYALGIPLPVLWKALTRKETPSATAAPGESAGTFLDILGGIMKGLEAAGMQEAEREYKHTTYSVKTDGAGRRYIDTPDGLRYLDENRPDVYQDETREKTVDRFGNPL